MCCCNVPIANADGTPALSHTRLLGRVFIAQTVPTIDTTAIPAVIMTPDVICSALAASTRGPAAVHRAKVVERGSYR